MTRGELIASFHRGNLKVTVKNFFFEFERDPLKLSEVIQTIETIGSSKISHFQVRNTKVTQLFLEELHSLFFSSPTLQQVRFKYTGLNQHTITFFKNVFFMTNREIDLSFSGISRDDWDQLRCDADRQHVTLTVRDFDQESSGAFPPIDHQIFEKSNDLLDL